MKDARGFWLLSLDNTSLLLFYLVILLLPTQLGKHFWFSFSYVLGVRVDYLSPTLYMTDILLIILFLIIIWRKRITISPYFSLFVLFLSLGIFFSSSPIIGWYGLIKFLELSFFIWYIVHERFNAVILGMLLATGIILESAIAFLQLVRQGSLGGLFYFLGERSFTALTPGIANASVGGELVLRPYATFSHPNMLGGYLVVGMLLVASLLKANTTRNRIVLSVSLVFGTMALAASLSRVAIATLALSGFVTLIAINRKKIGKQVLVSVVIVAASFLLAILFFPAIFTRILSFPVDQSFTQRAMLARESLKIIALAPLLGVGLNNFIPLLPFVARQGVVLQPVHNIYLLVAAETGGVGFFAGILSLAMVVRRLWHSWQKDIVEEKSMLFFVGLAMFALLFSGFFDHYFLTLQQGQLLFALVVGLCLRVTFSSGTIQK